MTYFMRGIKYRALCASTINRLRSQGYTSVVWRNGDFVDLI